MALCTYLNVQFLKPEIVSYRNQSRLFGVFPVGHCEKGIIRTIFYFSLREEVSRVEILIGLMRAEMEEEGVISGGTEVGVESEDLEEESAGQDEVDD